MFQCNIILHFKYIFWKCFKNILLSFAVREYVYRAFSYLRSFADDMNKIFTQNITQRSELTDLKGISCATEFIDTCLNCKMRVRFRVSFFSDFNTNHEHCMTIILKHTAHNIGRYFLYLYQHRVAYDGAQVYILCMHVACVEVNGKGWRRGKKYLVT